MQNHPKGHQLIEDLKNLNREIEKRSDPTAFLLAMLRLLQDPLERGLDVAGPQCSVIFFISQKTVIISM